MLLVYWKASKLKTLTNVYTLEVLWPGQEDQRERERVRIGKARHARHIQGHLEQQKHPYQDQTPALQLQYKDNSIIWLSDMETKNIVQKLCCMSAENIDNTLARRITNQELWRSAKQNPVFIITKERQVKMNGAGTFWEGKNTTSPDKHLMESTRP